MTPLCERLRACLRGASPHARNASDDFLLSASAHISSPDSKPRRSQCSLQPPRRHFFIMFSLRPATSDFHQVSFSVFIASLLRYHQSCLQRNASYFIITTRRDLTSPTRYLPGCPDDASWDDARLRDRPPSQPRTARSPVHDCISTHKPRRPLENSATCTATA